MAEQDAKQTTEIAAARAIGKPWYGKDGELSKSWESKHGAG